MIPRLSLYSDNLSTRYGGTLSVTEAGWATGVGGGEIPKVVSQTTIGTGTETSLVREVVDVVVDAGVNGGASVAVVIVAVVVLAVWKTPVATAADRPAAITTAAAITAIQGFIALRPLEFFVECLCSTAAADLQEVTRSPSGPWRVGRPSAPPVRVWSTHPLSAAHTSGVARATERRNGGRLRQRASVTRPVQITEYTHVRAMVADLVEERGDDLVAKSGRSGMPGIAPKVCLLLQLFVC